MKVGATSIFAMSEKQLSALLAKLKEDAGLQEKLKSAADLDAAVAIAMDAGFELTKEVLSKHFKEGLLPLTDEALEAISGGGYDTSGAGRTCRARCDTVGKNRDSGESCW